MLTTLMNLVPYTIAVKRRLINFQNQVTLKVLVQRNAWCRLKEIMESLFIKNLQPTLYGNVNSLDLQPTSVTTAIAMC